MVPTKRFWIALAVGILIAAASGAAGYMWLGFAYDILLVAVAYVTTRLAPSLDGLTFRRKMTPVLSVRVPNSVKIRILNEGSETISGRLRDEPPEKFHASRKEFRIHLRPGVESELQYDVTPYERGTDSFQGTFLRLDCPLGLVEREIRLSTEESVRIYPNVLALREFDLLKQKGKLNQIGIRRSRIRGLGGDFESLREYAEGDDYRKIDWKATARKGKLVVRQFEQERNQPVVLFIDVGRRMLSEVNGVTKLDLVLDSLLMLANAAVTAGDYVGLLVYSDVVKRYIPPRRGRNQLGILIEAIHDLVAEPVESEPSVALGYFSARWKRRSLIVSFTDVEDEEEARDLGIAFGPLAKRHLLLLARISDPRLKEAASQIVDEIDDVYLKASAMLFTNERKAAGSSIANFGIHTMDSEPQELAANLVSFYFVVKERSLL